MSNKKEFERITQNDTRVVSIKALSNQPNKKALYGEGGFTAEALKARFDAMPELGIEKINEIIESLPSGEFAKHIGINAAGEDNLHDFLALFKEATRNGVNIANYIKAYNNGLGGSKSLKEIVDALYSLIASNMSEIERVDQRVISLNNRVDDVEDLTEDFAGTFGRYNSRLLNIEGYLGGDNTAETVQTSVEQIVPENACEMAKITLIGGMNYGSKADQGNLFPYPYVDSEYVVDNRGAVTIRSNIDEGDSWILETYYAELPGGTYILDVGENINSSHNLAPHEIDGKSVSWELISPHQIRIDSDGWWGFSGVYIELAAYDSVTLYPVLYHADSPVTWQPRGGLNQPSKVTAISSENDIGGTLDRFRIPDEIIARADYGAGVSVSDYNAVEYTDNGVRFNKKVHAFVLDGTQTGGEVGRRDEIEYVYFDLDQYPAPRVYKLQEGIDIYTDVIFGRCSHYNYFDGANNSYNGESYVEFVNGQLRFVVYDEYGYVLSFDALQDRFAQQYAQGTPVIVWYTVEPESIDITDIMPRSNLIKVKPGKKVVCENYGNKAVPFGMKYLMRFTKEED